MNAKYQSGGRNTGSARQIKKPALPKEKEAGRALILSALSLLLPPVGMLFVWRSDQIRIAGKILLSLVATVSLTVMLSFTLRGSAGESIMPIPSVPQAPGYVAPTPVVAPAAQNQPGDAASQTPAPAGDDTGYGLPVEESGAASAPTKTPDITVYTVRSNASLYHAADNCDGQINRRELKLSEAIAEGLTACPKCSPPKSQ